jgi:anti-sigma factor RsiW
MTSTHFPADPHQTDCSALSELLPAYAIGATTREETLLVEQLLPLCPGAAEELAAYQRLNEGLVESVAPVAPPPALRGRILDAARASKPARPAAPPVIKTGATLSTSPSFRR